ncbi:MAG: VOC family protein [Gemmatimonadaceae bacterium]|nr:VOC family protein [Acetobacteraceae bacterium]
MPASPHTVDTVVQDMGRALAFYRLLGRDRQAEKDDEVQVEVVSAGGWTMGFILEAMVRRADPDWQTPVGQRVTLAFKCDDPAEVDALYRAVAAAGHPGVKEPWDAFWGQRYASLRDPDGNRVDLFAALPG